MCFDLIFFWYVIPKMLGMGWKKTWQPTVEKKQNGINFTVYFWFSALMRLFKVYQI